MTPISKIREELPYHFVNSAAQLTLATPIFALYETTVANMSVDQSIDTRLWASAVTLAGAGYLDAKFRDTVRNRLNVTQESPEETQSKVDRRSKMFFNTGRATLVYSLGLKGQDFSKLLRGVGLGVVYGKLFGAKSGYMMDLYRELSGIEASKRIPERIRELPSKPKKALMIGLMASSLALTGAVYKTIPPVKEKVVQTIDQLVAPS